MCRQPHLPRTVGEHDDMGTELGGGIDRVLAGRHGVDAAVEGILRPRPDLDARLLVKFAVAFDEPGLQRLDDHRSRLVEALPRLVHAQAKSGELPARKAAPETEAQPALAQHIEHSRLFGDTQRVVPGQDDRCGAKIDVGAERGQIGHQLKVVGHERIVVEVVLGRPQAVEAEVGGEPGQPDFLLPHARVGAIIPAVAGEHHHHADIHGALLRSLCVANYRSELPLAGEPGRRCRA